MSDFQCLRSVSSKPCILACILCNLWSLSQIRLFTVCSKSSIVMLVCVIFLPIGNYCAHDKIFYFVLKSFQSDEELHLFYCDSTLGCRVIQDFDLCKLDDL